MARTNDVSFLHPLMRGPVRDLEAILQDDFEKKRTTTCFRLFETYRSPEDQEKVFKGGTSQAAPWHSPHQWGMAADFVPWISGNWSWSSDHDYDHLAARAKLMGLHVPIAWDKVHVELPAWAHRRGWK